MKAAKKVARHKATAHARWPQRQGPQKAPRERGSSCFGGTLNGNGSFLSQSTNHTNGCPKNAGPLSKKRHGPRCILVIAITSRIHRRCSAPGSKETYG